MVVNNFGTFDGAKITRCSTSDDGNYSRGRRAAEMCSCNREDARLSEQEVKCNDES
jgi:hypothetical protein